MDLKQRAITSAAWFGASRVVVQGGAWVVTILLARLLTPQDYGMFAMALAVISFLELFQELGLGVAIVQRQDMSREQVNALFWIIFTASVIVATAAWLGAGRAAAFFGEPRIVWFVRALALTTVLNSLGLVPYNLLTREIDFRGRSLADVAGVLVQVAVPLPLAYLGFGVWALVAGQVARAAVRNAALIAFCRWAPGLAVSFAGIADIMRFGLRMAGTSALGSLGGAINASILAKSLLPAELGLYGMGRSLGLEAPHKLYTSVINQLSLPVFSKLQRNEAELRRSFLKITKYLALVALPLQVGMALVSTDLVVVVLSDKWRAAADLVPLFAVGGIFYSIILPSAPVLTARGRAKTLLRFSIVSTITMVLAIFVGGRFGLHAVAQAWLTVYAASRVGLLSLTLREIHLGPRAYLGNLSGIALAVVAMSAAVGLGRLVFPLPDSPLDRIVRDAMTGGIGYVVTLFLLDRRFAPEILGIMRAMRPAPRA